MPLEHLGIVVIGRNEGPRLITCLKSLESNQKQVAVVYVDSGSSDGSVGAAEQFGAFVVNLDMTKPFTAARARNEGLAALRAIRPNISFVQFIDGDCELARTWLDTALPFIEKQKDVAVVCGRRRERHPERSMYNRLCDIEWDTPVGNASACGGDSLVRVEAFQQVAGFRAELMAGEEPEMCARMRQRGWVIWRLDAEMTSHDAAMNRFGQWWLRAVRSGYAEAEISWLYPDKARNEKRKLARSVLWGGLLPLAILIGALFNPIAVLGALAYPVQISRIAIRRRSMGRESWTYAFFMTVAKFAQFQGNLRYYSHLLWKRELLRPIEYK